MFEYPKSLITLKIWKSLEFSDFFHFLEGGGYAVKLVTTKVIRLHIFLFKLSYFLNNNLWKKDMIVVVQLR